MKEIEPTAITEWFRKSEFVVPAYFNQSIIFRCTKRLNPYTFKISMRMLCGYHEVLRAFWNGKQLVLRDQTCLNLVLVEEHDFRHSVDFKTDMQSVIQKLQSTMDLTKGPLVHSGLFHLPEYDSVFIAIHHLVIDGVSWRILTEERKNLTGLNFQKVSERRQIMFPHLQEKRAMFLSL